MKVLKNAGKFEVLTKPEDVIRDITTAARTCYQSQDKSSPENDLKLVKNLMAREHFAMFEFSHMNIKFSDICRGFSHEMVRHRLCSFAQESTRYVNESDLNVVVPPYRDENEGIGARMGASLKDMNVVEWFEMNQDIYKSLLSMGWKPEDARQVLPIATRTQIVVGGNIREWRHIFHMRCDHFAHWEIRGVMLDLLRWCQHNIPVVFDDFHFFKTTDGREYARMVMPAKNIRSKIEHFMDAGGDPTDIFANMGEETKKAIFEALKIKVD